ncbi:MAG: FHA domain-containing protein [Blautia sp.]
MESTNLEDIDVAHTGILGGAYFDDNHSGILSDYTEQWVIEAYLVRLSNNERIVLNKPVFRVGRDKTKVDYCINNTGVSLIHIEFRQIDEKFYVKDLNSTNGTYINSERIESDMFYKIIHGDFIRIANEEFVFNER